MNQPQAKKGSLAGKLALTTAIGTVLWQTYPIVMVSRHAPEWGLYAWGIGALLFFGGVGGILKDASQTLTAASRTWRAYRPKVSDQSASWLTPREARRAGLTGSEGLFIGILEGHPLFLKNFVHGLCVAPSRSGKSSSLIMPALLHDPGCSRVVTDFNGHMTQQCAAAIRAQGHELVSLDPVGQTGEVSACLNPLDIIRENLEHAPQDAMPDCRTLSDNLCDGPVGGGDPFWRNGTRKDLTVLFISLCTLRPEEANLTTAFLTLSDSDELEELLLEASNCGALGGDVAALAKNVLSVWKETPKIFESFREGALQALESLGPSSRVAPIIQHSSFDPADLKKLKMTLTIACDASGMKEYRGWLKAVLWAVKTKLERAGNTVPVWFLLDEFTNYPLHGLTEVLTGLASAGIHFFIVVQELQELVRAYGPHALDVVLSQTDVKIFFGASIQKTARLISELLGEEEIITENFNLGMNPGDMPGLSIARRTRPLLAAFKIREMESDEALLIVGNEKPAKVLRAGFHEIEPQRSIVTPSSHFGGERYLGTVKMIIRNGRARATRAGSRKIKRARRPLIHPILAILAMLTPSVQSLIFIAAVLSVLQFGWPQLLWNYTASRSWCQYLSLPLIAEPVTLYGRDHCPVLLWVKPGGGVQ